MVHDGIGQGIAARADINLSHFWYNRGAFIEKVLLRIIYPFGIISVLSPLAEHCSYQKEKKKGEV